MSAAAIAINARQKRIARIAFRADGELGSPEMIQAIAEGMTLAEFDAGRYKTAGYDPFELTGLGIIVPERARAAARATLRTAGEWSASTATWRASSTTNREIR